MPKKYRNPRIPVAFTPSQYDVIHRLAELQGTSMAKVVKQFFEHVEPLLRDVVVALEAAQAAKGRPAAQLISAMANLQTSVQEMTQAAVEQGDMFSGQLERAKKKLRKRAVKAPVKRKRARA